MDKVSKSLEKRNEKLGSLDDIFKNQNTLSKTMYQNNQQLLQQKYHNNPKMLKYLEAQNKDIEKMEIERRTTLEIQSSQRQKRLDKLIAMKKRLHQPHYFSSDEDEDDNQKIESNKIDQDLEPLFNPNSPKNNDSCCNKFLTFFRR